MIINYSDKLEKLYNEKETEFFIPPDRKIVDKALTLLDGLNKKYTSLKNLNIDSTSYGTIVLDWYINENLLSYEIDRNMCYYTIKIDGEYSDGEDPNMALDINKTLKKIIF